MVAAAVRFPVGISLANWILVQGWAATGGCPVMVAAVEVVVPLLEVQAGCLHLAMAVGP